MSVSDDERRAYLEEIDVAYQEWLALIASIPEDDMLVPNTVGTWSGKDVVADVTGWEAETLRYIRELDAGRTAEWQPAEEDGTWDRFNQSNVDPTRDWTLAEVVADFQRVHGELMETAAASPNTPWRSVVRLTKLHYEEHYDNLREIPARVNLTSFT
jgi:hypothetical protein